MVKRYSEEPVSGSYLEALMNVFGLEQNDQAQQEEKKMADKKMTVEEVNENMKKQCGFVPRMFLIINTVTNCLLLIAEQLLKIYLIFKSSQQ